MTPPQGSARPGALGELGRYWRVLFACCVGAAVGAAAFPLYIVPVIAIRLEGAFGWSRLETSSLVSTGFAGAALGAPLVGWLNDRWSIRLPALASTAAIGLTLGLASAAPGDIRVWQLGTFCLTLFGAGTLSAAYLKIVSQHFHAMRGLALGLTIGSVSLLSAVALPRLTGWIDTVGLATFFAAAAGFYFLVALPFLAWALPADRNGTAAGPTLPADDTPVPSPGAALWVLATAGILVASATGAAAHLVAIAADGGRIAPSVVGAVFATGVMLARPVTGLLIDRVNAARVGAVAFALAAAGLSIVAISGDRYILIATILLSGAVGADIDVVAYLTSKYVGAARFGRVFGWIYCGVLVAAALGPVLVGLERDLFGSYRVPFLITAVMVAVAAGLMLALPPYAGPGRERS